MGLGLFLNINAAYEIRELQSQLLKKQRELRDLAKLSAILADGVVKVEEAASLPSSNIAFAFEASRNIFGISVEMAARAVAQADALRAETNAVGQKTMPFQQAVYEQALAKFMTENAKAYTLFIKEEEQRIAADVEMIKQQLSEAENMQKMGQEMQKKSNQSISFSG